MTTKFYVIRDTCSDNYWGQSGPRQPNNLNGADRFSRTDAIEFCRRRHEGQMLAQFIPVNVNDLLACGYGGEV